MSDEFSTSKFSGAIAIAVGGTGLIGALGALSTTGLNSIAPVAGVVLAVAAMPLAAGEGGEARTAFVMLQSIILSLPVWVPYMYYESFALNRIQGRAAALRRAGMGKFTYHAAWDVFAALVMGLSGALVLGVGAICRFSFSSGAPLPFQIVSYFLAGLQASTLMDVLQNAASSREQFQQVISPVSQLIAFLSTVLVGILGDVLGPVGLAVLSFFPTVPVINAVDAGVFGHYSGCSARDIWLGERRGLAGIGAQLAWIVI